MKGKTIDILGRVCRLYRQTEAEFLLIQPVDEHDSSLLDTEVDTIHQMTNKPFSLVAFKINDWNKELAPWTTPPVFGREPFGDGSRETLGYVTNTLLPYLSSHGMDAKHVLLGGYSLAGLFALWSGYQTDIFEGIVAASPSVWYPGWIEKVTDEKPKAASVYLSLGDKEEKTKHPVMSQVGDAIRKQHELLLSQGIDTILEWNPGNHFVDMDKRMAKGFARLMGND